MRADDIRKLSIEKMRAELDDARENYFRLRFQFATGQLTDHTRLSIARRDIARLATIIKESEREAEQQGSDS